MKPFIFITRGRFATFFLLIGALFMFYSCDKEEDIKNVAPIEKIETSITFKPIRPDKSMIYGTSLKLTRDQETIEASKTEDSKAKLTSGYTYNYEISKDYYVTAVGSVKAKPAPFEKEVTLDTPSIKVNPYQSDAKITATPVADAQGTAKSGAVAMTLEAGKSKKIDSASNAGFYKVLIKVGDHTRDSVVDLKNTAHDITMAVGYYLTINTVPKVVSSIASVTKEGNTTALTAESDGRYFIGYQDTGKYEIKSKSGSDFSEKKKTVHIATANVTTSLYLYTDVNVQIYNSVHGGNAAAFDYKYIRVKNESGEDFEGSELKTVDLSAAASGSVSKDSTTKVNSAGYYKFIATGLSGQFPDSTIVNIQETDGYKPIKLEIRPILDLQLSTAEATDSVSVNSIKLISESTEKEYKTDSKLGITVPTEYKKATLTTKIPSLPTQNSNDHYYLMDMSVKNGDDAKNLILKFTLAADGTVKFYGNESDSFQADAITFGAKQITFDYTKL